MNMRRDAKLFAAGVVMGVTMAVGGRVGHINRYNITPGENKAPGLPRPAAVFDASGMDRAPRLCYFPVTGQALRKRPETYSLFGQPGFR